MTKNLWIGLCAAALAPVTFAVAWGGWAIMWGGWGMLLIAVAIAVIADDASRPR